MRNKKMNEKQEELIKKHDLVEIKPEEKKDKNGKLIYKKYSNGGEYHAKYENGKLILIYQKYSNGGEYHAKYENGKLIYEKYPDRTEYKYEDDKLIYKKYPDGRFYIDGKYYQKKAKK